MKRNLGPFVCAFVLLGFLALPAKADLKLCNNTTSSVNVAVGYKEKKAGLQKAGGKLPLLLV
jgi:uncharacterized membrane protein